MLTEAEKDWMAKRDIPCRRCEFGDDCQLNPKGCDDFRPKEMWEDYLSAATFEARVAVLLTDRDASYVPPCHIVCSRYRNCRACRLMYARLAVEAEMDK